jgi:uncharacterized repeat protein (TIGR04052 family)
MKTRQLIWIASLSALLACGDDVDAPEDEVVVSFVVAAGDTEWSCGDTVTVGTAPSEFVIEDLRFYVHGVALIRDDGAVVNLTIVEDNIWSQHGTTLLDFEDGTGPCDGGNAGLNRSVVGSVPEGDYVGLTFVLGVPFSENHQDAGVAQAPFSYSAMFWGWQGGYKFLRLDGATVAGNGNRIHLGSTGCEGEIGNITRCTHENRASVVLDAFDAGVDSVVFDLGALFGDSDLETNTDDTPLGCMSTPDDPDCDALFEALGLGDSLQTAFGAR